MLFSTSFSPPIVHNHTRQAHIRVSPLFPQQSGDSRGFSTCSKSGSLFRPVRTRTLTLIIRSLPFSHRIWVLRRFIGSHRQTHIRSNCFFLIRHSQDRSQEFPRFASVRQKGSSKQASRRNVSGGKGNQDVLLMLYDGGQFCFPSFLLLR